MFKDNIYFLYNKVNAFNWGTVKNLGDDYQKVVSGFEFLF